MEGAYFERPLEAGLHYRLLTVTFLSLVMLPFVIVTLLTFVAWYAMF